MAAPEPESGIPPWLFEYTILGDGAPYARGADARLMRRGRQGGMRWHGLGSANQVHQVRRRAALLSTLLSDAVASGQSISSFPGYVRGAATSPNAPAQFRNILGYRVAEGYVPTPEDPRFGSDLPAMPELRKRRLLEASPPEFIVTPRGELCLTAQPAPLGVPPVTGDPSVTPIRNGLDIPADVDIVRGAHEPPTGYLKHSTDAKICALYEALGQHIAIVRNRLQPMYSEAERDLLDLRADTILRWPVMPPRALEALAPSYTGMLLDPTSAVDPWATRYRRLVSGTPASIDAELPAHADRRLLGQLRASNVVITESHVLAIEDVYTSGVGPFRRQATRLRPLRSMRDMPARLLSPGERQRNVAREQQTGVQQVELIRQAVDAARIELRMLPEHSAQRPTRKATHQHLP